MNMCTYLRKFLILIGCNVDEIELDFKLNQAPIFVFIFLKLKIL
jgi:hypothetical protein